MLSCEIYSYSGNFRILADVIQRLNADNRRLIPVTFG